MNKLFEFKTENRKEYYLISFKVDTFGMLDKNIFS